MEKPNRDKILQEFKDKNWTAYGSSINNEYHKRLEEYVDSLEGKLESCKSLMKNSVCIFCNNTGTVHVPEEEYVGFDKQTCDNCIEKHEILTNI